jgi:hypothetical protein
LRNIRPRFLEVVFKRKLGNPATPGSLGSQARFLGSPQFGSSGIQKYKYPKLFRFAKSNIEITKPKQVKMKQYLAL